MATSNLEERLQKFMQAFDNYINGVLSLHNITEHYYSYLDLHYLVRVDAMRVFINKINEV